MRLLVSYQLKWPGGLKIADDEHDEDKHILITGIILVITIFKPGMCLVSCDHFHADMFECVCVCPQGQWHDAISIV